MNREAEAGPRAASTAAMQHNLNLRLLTAAVLIPIVCWAIWQGGFALVVVVTAITLIGVDEFYRLIEAKGAAPLRSFGYAAAGALPLLVHIGGHYPATVLLSAALLCLLVAQLGKAQISESLASISGAFFGIFYVGWLLSHAVALRDFHGVLAARWGEAVVAGLHPQVGGYYLFFAIAVVVGGDAGAYFVGRAYGRRKLAPRVSPGKTIEGALGAVLAGALVGLGCKLAFTIWAPGLAERPGWFMTLALAMLLSVAGILGDLVESLLKRDARVKDSGSLLPGTGGVLDRIDSSLIAIPVLHHLLLLWFYAQPRAGG